MTVVTEIFMVGTRTSWDVTFKLVAVVKVFEHRKVGLLMVAETHKIDFAAETSSHSLSGASIQLCIGQSPDRPPWSCRP